MNPAYSQRTDSSHPQLFGLAIDESDSMRDPIGLDEQGAVVTKHDASVRAVKEEVFDEVLFTAREDADLRDMFHAFGVGFGGRARDLWNGQLLHTAELTRSPRLRAQGDTPMHEGLVRVRDRLVQILPTYQDCNPPVVLLLSDGMATGPGDVEAVGREIQELTTNYGNVLILCCYMDLHVPNAQLQAREDPTWPEGAKLLFKIASEIPPGSRIERWFHEHKAQFPTAPQPGDRLMFQVGDMFALRAAISVVASTLGNSNTD